MISLNLLPDVKKNLLKVRRERNLVITVSLFAMVIAGGALLLMGTFLGGLSIAKALDEGRVEKFEKQIKQAQEDKELNQYLTIQNQLSQLDSLKDSQMVYSRLMGYLTALNPAQPNNVSIRTATLTGPGADASTTSDTAAAGGVSMTIEGTTASFASLDVYKNTLQKAQITYETVKDETDDDDETDQSASDSDSSDQADQADQDDQSDEQSSDEDTKATKEPLFTSVSVTESNLSSDQNESNVSFTIQVVFTDNAFSSKVTEPKIEVPKETTSDGDRNAPKQTFKSDEKDNQTSGSGSDGGEGGDK